MARPRDARLADRSALGADDRRARLRGAEEFAALPVVLPARGRYRAPREDPEVPPVDRRPRLERAGLVPPGRRAVQPRLRQLREVLQLRVPADPDHHAVRTLTWDTEGTVRQ